MNWWLNRKITPINVLEKWIEAGKISIKKSPSPSTRLEETNNPYTVLSTLLSAWGQDWNTHALGRPLVDDAEPSIRLSNQELEARKGRLVYHSVVVCRVGSIHEQIHYLTLLSIIFLLMISLDIHNRAGVWILVCTRGQSRV